MSISKEEFVARHGEKYAPYYQEYDSDLKPEHNFRIFMEMQPVEPSSRYVFWSTIVLIVVVVLLWEFFPYLVGYWR